MVYEMFSKGFIFVVVVVAFIAFIILMEGVLLVSIGLAQSHLVLLTCSFLINAKTPKNGPEMADRGYMLTMTHSRPVGTVMFANGDPSEATIL